ncbi:MAG: SRPBCC domain-containing protein [Balneolaceae bacterium]|nr:SRPBCC domain-containing protein [Balneolaceae bacterium]MBO6546870.1 SRPBCC domain-containing protein [Balneolaceae bacterium]MBO6649230.1 SRPBCC domain-containing protein [Balneolaceae bacterium]
MENRIELKTTISTSLENVWDALTNPDKIEEYMFGARCESDWRPGSKSNFFVKQDDKEVTVVKGEVIRSEPHKYLEHTLFPANSNIEDTLENYIVVIYELNPISDTETELTITQKGYKYVENGMERYIETQKGWKVALPKLKEVAEG